MNVVSIIIGVALGLGFYLIFANVIRKFWIAPPSEPNPEDLQDVELSYRCAVCGSQVIMTVAPSGEVPEAPRHCKEDMILTTSN